jgi:hypothetical protein
MVLAETKVSIDTFVQLLCLCASGLVRAVNAGLIQINANNQIHVYRDSSCTSERLSRIPLARDLLADRP